MKRTFSAKLPGFGRLLAPSHLSSASQAPWVPLHVGTLIHLSSARFHFLDISPSSSPLIHCIAEKPKEHHCLDAKIRNSIRLSPEWHKVCYYNLWELEH